MDKEFLNKVVIVTGGAGGIGSTTAMDFAIRGAKVAVVDFNEELGLQTINEIVAAGGESHFFKVDVTDYEQVKQCVQQVVDYYGTVDVLINVAGGSARSKRAPFYNQSIEVFKNVIDINLNGSFYFCKECAKIMMEKGYGRIINTASVVGLNGHTMHSEYAASKGAIISLTKAMAKDIGKFGVTVNSVSPGMIPTKNATNGNLNHTNFLNTTPDTSDISNAYMFLASDKAKFITGFNLVVDGGRHLGTKGTDN